MMNFRGRKKELDILQKKYDRDGFCLSIIYGRRRIGKTTLVNEFIKRQECKKISFVAVEQGEKELLSMMKNEVLNALAPEMADIIDFQDFGNLFEFIGKFAQKERVIFFIDEYPYLAKQCPYIQSLLQNQIDSNWKDSKMFFIICGSLVGFMKDEVLAESAPLHGRSDLEMRLRPFGYEDTALFLNGYTYEEKAIVYGLTGGVAKYVDQFDSKISLDENIKEQFYSMGGYFSEEQVKTVLSSDRQNPALYNSIISAIATGHTKHNEISGCVGMDDITYPLKVLAKAEIIEKRFSPKPYYVLNDSMLEFWFRYVNPASSLINSGNGEKYYDLNVKNKLHDFMGKIFEKMAKEFLMKNAGMNGIPLISEITDYQNTFLDENRKPVNVELDLLGKLDQKYVLIGECKFKNEKFDKSELEKVMDKIKYLPTKELTICLFSLSGFTDYVQTNAGNCLLFSIQDMYKPG